ncbi:MAG: hypothetical protein IPI42_14740 [Saprospiraceae bacterium]|nr:hypothetical protein [Candidatus Parvibacillus calidus]
MNYLELYTAVQDTSAKEYLNMKIEDLKAGLELHEKERKITKLDSENKKAKFIRNILIIGICLLLFYLFLVVLLQIKKQSQ